MNKIRKLAVAGAVVFVHGFALYPHIALAQQGAKPEEICHAQLANKKCVNLIGKWEQKKSTRGQNSDVLMIGPSEKRSHFTFELDVTRAEPATQSRQYWNMGRTIIIGEFLLKDELDYPVGVHIGEGSDRNTKCVITFRPIIASRILITHFGECEEATRTVPSGAYEKMSSTYKFRKEEK